MNHAQEAKRLISATDTKDWNNPSPYVDRRIAAAQVHATLALAEQQRIANLIALASIPNQNGYENETYDARNIALFEGLFDWEDITTLPDNQDQRMIVRPEIVEALGLGDPK